MPKWLENACFYEIYPQSFFDANGDGIGDLEGIRQKLPYIQSLGCNAIWLNPCFVSPFADAGYDVADYCKIAPRYGTNEEMKALLDAAHELGIYVALDLVAGHTSIEHPWFVQSCRAEQNEYSDRFIWTRTEEEASTPGLDRETVKKLAGAPAFPGVQTREGKYYFNYYDIQPALNYGFARVDADWQTPCDAPAAIATREALKDVMRFWLDMGVDGFRVDMAMSLVKNDMPDRLETRRLWQNVRAMLDKEYPQAALISEWFNPAQSLDAGFHVDFYLQANPGYISMLMAEDASFFHPDGDGSCAYFAMEYANYWESCKQHPGSFISTPTGNHDMTRMSYHRTKEEISLILAFDFTLPGIPVLYYGDEIGMKYLELPSKEGGLYRTGSRTPMQWSDAKNAGFSETDDASRLYLPIDPDENRPTAAAQESDPDSLLNLTRRLIRLRSENPALANTGAFESLYAEDGEYPYVYARTCPQQRLAVCVNPSAREAEAVLDGTFTGEPLFLLGGAPSVSVENGKTQLKMAPQSFCIMEVPKV